MITTSSGPGNEGMILRFVFDTKAGTYPLTGMSFGRGKDDNAQQFGGLMGGEEKLYGTNVTLTECKDMGDNGAGGHKWKISGSIENLTIPALGIMLLEKEKNHPKEIKIDKISFTDLSFDDNAEEVLQKAMDQLKEMNKNNEARKAFYKGDFPAATWVQVSRLYMHEARLEVELVAHLPK